MSAFVKKNEAELRRANGDVELRARLVEDFSRLRREDEARTTTAVGSMASLVSGTASENPEEGSTGQE